ncbi:hypothetical protein G6N74_13520 [Mesorhizobium sp. CGMCC 1.15528]|uniref:Uncharacterized protein n=1 Tax=Mesorhizobium zhangyense TaxID=1776730 RepID=A0A7C9V778_9HYPH|nr:hypothetical protein [Mesorhizobium zhangyense]NGN42084.1 hypothetical protein [Mesorhizobium zhangyense]
MTNPHDSHSGSFHPANLALVNRVVGKVLQWHGLSEKGPDAAYIGGRALLLFDTGVVHEEALFKKLRREPLPRRSHRAFSDLVRLDQREWRQRGIRTNGEASS